MLKGLIKSNLDSEQAEQRLAAIEKLKSPDEQVQTRLCELVRSDPDNGVVTAALKKLTLLPLLAGLLEPDAESSGKKVATQDDAVARRLTDLLELKPDTAVVDKLLESSPVFATVLACSSADEALRQTALGRISDEAVFARIAADAKTHQTRMAAAELITNPEVQQTCLAQTKNRDKVVARLLQKKLTEHNTAVEKVEMHRASVRQLIASMQSLSASAWSPQYVGQFSVLEKRWQALQPEPDAESQAKFETARSAADIKVRKFRLQQDKLEALRSVHHRAEVALEELTSAKLSSLESATGSAVKVLASLNADWLSAGQELDVENPFSSEFNESLGMLDQLVPLSKNLVANSVHDLSRRKLTEQKVADNPVQKTGEEATESRNPSAAAMTKEPGAESKPTVQEAQNSETPASEGTAGSDNVSEAESAPNSEADQALQNTPATHSGENGGASDDPVGKAAAPSSEAAADVNTKKSTAGNVRQAPDPKQRAAIEKALANESFVAQMACVSQLGSLLGQLDAEREKDRQQQAQLSDGIRRQLNVLTSTIDAGKWSSAEGMSQRIARKLEQLKGEQLKPLKSRYEKQLAKLNDLADWQDFAALPKLQELVTAMRELPAQNIKPRQLADEIKSLQTRWKALGSSRVANQHWEDFKTASDIAYEPCKEYFDGLKKQREARERNKEGICQRLQECIDSAKQTDAQDNPRELERTLSQLRREWQNNRTQRRRQDAKIEQRFTGLCDALEELLVPMYESGKNERQDLIEKARKLSEGETNQHVINQAKGLQASWKLCAPASRKDDRKLWGEFNELCGVIFGKQREERRAQYKASMQHVDRAREIIKSIRNLAKKAGDKEEKLLSELQDEFNQLPEFPEKSRRGLLKDFRAAGDSFGRARSSQGKKQQVREISSLRELARLCEQIERAEIQWNPSDEQIEGGQPGVDAADSDDTAAARAIPAEEASDHWVDFASHIPKPWLKRIQKRRDSAVKLLQAGKSPFDDKQDHNRRLQCIRLEIMRDKETPAEDKALRMQYQLEQLQAGPDSALRDNDSNSLRELEIDWLCLPPASPAIAASLDQRFSKALGA